MELWYAAPAREWVEALPLGNGRIGAMVYGGVERERLALNEDTLWSGFPRRYTRANAPERIAEAQRLVRDGDLAGAENIIEQDVQAENGQAYMPLGDLLLYFPGLADTSGYRRSLNLETGVHTVSFEQDGARHTRECFISHPDQALILRIAASKPGRVGFTLRLETLLKRLEARSSLTGNGGECLLRALCPSQAHPKHVQVDVPFVYEDAPEKKGVRFAAVARLTAQGGSVELTEEGLRVHGADSVLVVFCARTSFNGFDRLPFLEGRDCEADVRADIERVSSLGFDLLKARHTADFAALMRRCALRLDAPRPDRSTIDRLRAFARGEDDPALYELIFQYGRYLTVSASRPGTQCANLQGIWNDSMRPPWSSNYTVNINTEMNYWPAEPANLSEMTEPLHALAARLRVTGADAARVFYGARGACAHHNADLWAHATPVSGGDKGSMVWAFWPMALGWLSRHLYDHYLYTLDREFLQEKVLPILRDSARFFCDVLREDGEGNLAFYPATSPENHFLRDGQDLCGALSATMSEAIMREVFGNYLAALQTLGLDEDLSAEVREKRARLRPYRVGSKGQLLEWNEEFEEAEPHHRHQSHLYGLYPGVEIDESTPELLAACRRSLELRGDEGTGWSLGWKINLWARLGDGVHALRLLRRQLRLVGDSETNFTNGGGTYPNLFDAHPPFQIDGNFGAAAGICEMLLRSRPDRIDLLPALPPEWPDGEVTGLRAMGDITVDIRFAGGVLAEAVVTAHQPLTDPVRVLYQGRELAVLRAARTYRLS